MSAKRGKHMKNLLTDAEIAAEVVVDAAQGDADAQAYLGINYTHGWDGFPCDPERALHWFRLAGARRGDRGDGVTGRASTADVIPTMSRIVGVTVHRNEEPNHAGVGGEATQAQEGERAPRPASRVGRHGVACTSRSARKTPYAMALACTVALRRGDGRPKPRPVSAKSVPSDSSTRTRAA